MGPPARGRPAGVAPRQDPGGWGIDYEDLVTRLHALVGHRADHLSGDEKGEAQVFLERLFRAFGHEGHAGAGAKLEARIEARDTKGSSVADLVWEPRVLVEVKKAGTDLGEHYRRAFDDWLLGSRTAPGTWCCAPSTSSGSTTSTTSSMSPSAA